MAKTIQGALTQSAINTDVVYTKKLRGRKMIKILSADFIIVPNVAGALAAADMWEVCISSGVQTAIQNYSNNTCKYYKHAQLNAVPDDIDIHWWCRNLPPFPANDFTIVFNTASRANNGVDTCYYTITYEEYESGY
jgi:hypothetical protein